MSDPILQLLLGPAGTLVFALVVLVGGWRKWWVYGWRYRELSEEKNEWKRLALRGTKMAERVVNVAEKRLDDDSS